MIFRVIIIILLLPLYASGQQIKVIRTEILDSTEQFQPVSVSPAGDKILASREAYSGLYCLELSTGTLREISDASGAGYGATFSPDGGSVYYRSDSWESGIRLSSLHEFEFNSGSKSLLETGVRDLHSPVTAGKDIVWSADGNIRHKSPSAAKKAGVPAETFVIAENMTPVIFSGGTRGPLAPNGPGNYIWISLSPDRNKVLYNFGGRGTYVCDLKGKIIADAGRLNAPKWLNDNIIIGMDDRDDGHRVVSSEIVAYIINSGRRVNLTNTAGTIEMYPIPFPDGNRIIFCTDGGGMSVIYLKTE